MKEENSTTQTSFEDESSPKLKKGKDSNSGKSYWIFQSKKETFDISDPETFYKGLEEWWHANQNANEMKAGDEVFFWLAGKEEYRGIYGTGILTSSAYPPEDKSAEKDGLRVNYKCLKRLSTHISIQEIRQNDSLKNLQILRQPQASNFLIKVSEADALFEIISSREEKYNDPSKLHLDTDTDVDNLGRKGFVDALAIWINRIWEKSNQNEEKAGIEKNSFMMHLHGPWGSGKSTILNLLEKNLAENEADKSKEWIVIKFNAWENCHIQPVWWPLLKQLYKDSRVQLNDKKQSCLLWLYDAWWKLISGNKTIGILFISVLLMSLLFITGSVNTIFDTEKLEDLKAHIKLLLYFTTLISGGAYFIKSMVWGSAEAAEVYLKLHQDPLERIKKYFRRIVKITERPIMVFIDDLDRCEPEYVVKLLENIQTLFNNSRVFYLVAADRRWIYSSFQNKYGDFKNEIEEPGKHIGYLFLDKIFQLSISVPKINTETQKSYLSCLYNEKTQGADSDEIKNATEEAKATFKNASVEEIINTVSNLSENTPANHVWKEEALKASASEDIEVETEFFLLQFSHLLEKNPRSIKRLVNNYGVYRAIAILSDTQLVNNDENRKKFALWNILKMRWPLFVEYLEENPNKIEEVLDALNNEDYNGIHPKIDELLKRPNILNSVIKDNKLGVSLDFEYLQKVLKLEKAE